MNDKIKQLGTELNTIAVFRNVLLDSVVSRLKKLTETSPDDSTSVFLERYPDLFRSFMEVLLI